MSELFASGRVVDLIVVLVILEGVALAAYHRRTGRGIGPRALWWNLVAGCALLFALRNALMHAEWPAISACLLVAFGAHVADLRKRLPPGGS
jgi:hypothetical protein